MLSVPLANHFFSCLLSIYSRHRTHVCSSACLGSFNALLSSHFLSPKCSRCACIQSTALPFVARCAAVYRSTPCNTYCSSSTSYLCRSLGIRAPDTSTSTSPSNVILQVTAHSRPHRCACQRQSSHMGGKQPGHSGSAVTPVLAFTEVPVQKL